MIVGPTNQPAAIARRTSLMAYSALLPTSRTVVNPWFSTSWTLCRPCNPRSVELWFK